MLKAIVAKVARAAANARRVGCALAEDIRGDARAAILVAAKKAVGAAFCGVATAVFLAPVSLVAVNDAVAQTQSQTCNDQKRSGGANTTGCGDCLTTGTTDLRGSTPVSEDYVEVGGECEPVIDCSAITGQAPNDNNDACVCPEDNFAIDGACQTLDNFCASADNQSVRENFSPDLGNLSADEAEDAYCRECALGDNYEKFAGDCELVKDCSITSSEAGSGLFRGQFLDRENKNNECVCPSGQTILPEPDELLVRAKEQSDSADDLGAKVCAPALPDYANHYTAADCEEAKWEVTYRAVTLAAQGQPQGGFHLVESCQIPVKLFAGAVLTVLSTVTGETEVRTIGDSTGSASSCVLRRNTGADLDMAVGGSNARFCDDPVLFNTNGLPERPANLIVAQNDSLDVVSMMTAENMSIRISYKKQPVLLAGAAPTTPTTPDPNGPPAGPTDSGEDTSAASGGGGGGGAGPAAGGGILLLALAYYAFSGHDSGASFALTPQASYVMENDLELYRYGSRLEFRQDEWTLWWAADESSSGGGKSLSYGYGGQWSNDALRASAGVNYDESSADMRAGLEAEWTLSNWTIRPAYRFSAVTDEGEWNVKNGLDLTAQMTQAGWTVRPSVNAGLWSGDALDADLGLQVGREF